MLVTEVVVSWDAPPARGKREVVVVSLEAPDHRVRHGVLVQASSEGGDKAAIRILLLRETRLGSARHAT
jgi:hypothetical protein